MATATLKDEDHMVRQDVLSLPVLPGGLRQQPDGRAAVLLGAKPGEIGELRAWTTEGVFRITKAANVVILDGCPVYWSRSLQSAGSTGDYLLGIARGDAAAADDLVFVDLNKQALYLINSERSRMASVPVGAATASRLGLGYQLSLTSAAEAQKIDLLSEAAIPVTLEGISEFVFAIVNQGNNAALDFNIGLAVGTHASDADSIGEYVFLHLDGNSLAFSIQSKDGTTTVPASAVGVNAVVSAYNTLVIDHRDLSDVKLYLNGARINQDPAVALNLSAAVGPLKLLAHLEKTSNATVGEVRVESMRMRAFDAV